MIKGKRTSHSSCGHFPYRHPHLTCILHDHLYIINTSPRLRGALPPPPLVAYCSPPNLKDHIVRAAYGRVKETYKGNSQCQQPHCKACAHVKTGTTFCTMTTGEKFHVKATADCQTRSVLYLIECKKCSIQYIGEMGNALCVRLTGHCHGHMNKQCPSTSSCWITL